MNSTIIQKASEIISTVFTILGVNIFNVPLGIAALIVVICIWVIYKEREKSNILHEKMQEEAEQIRIHNNEDLRQALISARDLKTADDICEKLRGCKKSCVYG